MGRHRLTGRHGRFAGGPPLLLLLLLLAPPATEARADAQWTPIFHTPTHEIILTLSSPSDSTCWFITNFARLYKTSDGGVTWTTMPPGTFLPSGLFVINNTTAFKTSSQDVWRTTNGGATWTSVFFNAGSGPPVVWMASASTGVMAYDGVLYKSTNGGASWSSAGVTQPPAPIEQSDGRGSIWADGDNLWVALSPAGVAYSPDLGTTWSVPQNHGLGKALRISFADVRFGLALQRNSPFVYVTTDGGDNWIATDNSFGANEDVLAVGTRCWYTPNPADHVYIKYSTDAGASWAEQVTDPGGFEVLHRSRNGRTLWAGTGLGTIYTYQSQDPAGVGTDVSVAAGLLAAPNPFRDRLMVSGSRVRDGARFRLITVAGAPVMTGVLRQGGINTEALPPGWYGLEVFDARGRSAGRARVVKS